MLALDVPAMKTLKTLVRSTGYTRLRMGRLPSRSDRGGAIIEMVVLSPLLIVLVFGAGDFARVMYHAITLTNAARAGAAYGAQSNGQLADTTGIRLAAEQEAQNIGAIAVTSQRVCECGGTAVACTAASCPGYGAVLAFSEVTATQTFTTLTGSFPGIPASVPVTRVAKVRAQ